MKVGDKLWFVPEKGEMFGKNLTSPSNPKETQPIGIVSASKRWLTLIWGA